MAITIGPLPQGTQTDITFAPSVIDNKPFFGGPSQRITRHGSERFTVVVQCQPMSYAQGVLIVSQLIRGVSEQVTLALHQPELAGLTGTISTSSPVPGQFCNYTAGGYSYLHVYTAGGVYPLYRATGGTLSYANPTITGFISGDSCTWTYGLAATIGLTFSITESR